MNPIIKKNGINYGIVMGIISILVTASIYAIDLKLFANIWLGLAIIALFIVIGIVLVSKTKQQLTGFITFKEAFTVYFIGVTIAISMSALFNYFLFNIIDTEAKETVNQILLETNINFMKKMGAPMEEITKQAVKLKDHDNYSLLNLLKGLVINLTVSSIFGSLLALIFRNKTSNLE